MMELAADILLALGALGTGIFCLVLIRRLRSFNNLERGVGGAITVLSAQVEQLNQTLKQAQKDAQASEAALQDLTTRAEATARQLEMMLAATTDIASEPPAKGGGDFVRHDRKKAS